MPPCPVCNSLEPLDILFTTSKGEVFYSCKKCKENVFNLAICRDMETEKESVAYLKKHINGMKDKTFYDYVICFINKCKY